MRLTPELLQRAIRRIMLIHDAFYFDSNEFIVFYRSGKRAVMEMMI